MQRVIQLTDLRGDEVKYGSENLEAVLEHFKKKYFKCCGFFKVCSGLRWVFVAMRALVAQGLLSRCISGASVAVASLLFPSAGWPVSQSVGSRGSRA